jgi:GxxExxY protein
VFEKVEYSHKGKEQYSMEINEITGTIVDSAIKVHSILGPGLLESRYEVCLVKELTNREVRVRRQVALPVVYEGEVIEAGYRIDLLVEEEVIVELKSVEKLLPIHEAQLLSYLKLSNKKIGLLLNFNLKYLKNGIKRMAN